MLVLVLAVDLYAFEEFQPQDSTSTSTSTLFRKTIGYNRLARKIVIANLGGPVKRKINCKEKKGKEKEGKLQTNTLIQKSLNY